MMKTSTLLLGLSGLLTGSLVAQAPAPAESTVKRITITRTVTDDDGKVVTEAWIAEGETPEKILGNMAIDPATIQQVTVTNGPAGEDEERLFLLRKAGNDVVVEVRLGDAPAESPEVIITADEFVFHNQFAPAIKYQSRHAGERSNCAALGVYVGQHDGHQGGARINSVIDQSGASSAGLQEGDVLQKIDEFEIPDYAALHLAMAHFQPGQEVTVSFLREDAYLTAKVTLTNWAAIPGHEWRARTDCGNEAPADTPVDNTGRDDVDIEPTRTLQPLELTDARFYPNPTDGILGLSFTADPAPVSIAVTDVNGKVVFQEDNDLGSGRYDRMIDLSDVAPGNYILTIRQGDKIHTHQIAKQ